MQRRANLESKNLESFVQETGRAGRDGGQSISYLTYHGLLLTHLTKRLIKEYIELKDCRRKGLLKYFANSGITAFIIPHFCRDNCALTCKCELLDCGKQLTTKYPSVFSPKMHLLKNVK